MPFQPIDNVAQINVRQRLDNQKIENVFHVFNETASQQGTLQNLADLFGDFWLARVLPVQSADLTLVEVEARDLSTEGGLSAVRTINPAVAGGNIEASLPNNVAFCVSFRTARTGRSYRGRTYVAGIPEGRVVKNTLDAAVVTTLVTAFSDLALTDSYIEQGYLVVASRFNQGVRRPTGVATRVTGVLAIDPIVDSQRRRLPGRGQ